MQRSHLILASAAASTAIAFFAGRSSTGAPSRAVPAQPPARAAAPHRTPRSTEIAAAGPRTAMPTAENPRSLLNQLAGMSVTEGSPKTIRPVLVALEQLSRLGPKALPEIRRFLATGEDARYLPENPKRLREVRSMVNALVPATLRLALFDVVAQAGGEEADSIVVESIASTRRGLELAYLSELSGSGNHHDATIAAATRLLADGDPADRGILYEILGSLKDTSSIASARSQMIRPDGKIDRDALRYLQQTLGPQSVALAARAYQDPRLNEPGSKEPLARTALAFVGADPQALQLFHTALMDSSLHPDQKRELVEDLNQDGIANRKSPTEADLQVITNRYQLTQSYLQEAYVQGDPTLSAAFREADKDLRMLLERAAAAPKP